MNSEADKIINEMCLREIPRHDSGKVDVNKYREASWQTMRATAIKLGCIEQKLQDNKVVRRLAYFAAIGFLICASAMVFLHVGWEYATGTMSLGVIAMKLLSAIKGF